MNEVSCYSCDQFEKRERERGKGGKELFETWVPTKTGPTRVEG
jgi:hypothetical protein